MKGWLWKADRDWETGIQRRQRARLGVQTEASHGGCYRVLVRGGKSEKRRTKKLSRAEGKMWKWCLRERADIGQRGRDKEGSNWVGEIKPKSLWNLLGVASGRRAQGEWDGGHELYYRQNDDGDVVVIKKCEILTSELSVVSWGIYLWRAGKREEQGVVEGTLLTVRSIDFSLLLYLIAQALTPRWFGFSLVSHTCVCILQMKALQLFIRQEMCRDQLKMTRLQTPRVCTCRSCTSANRCAKGLSFSKRWRESNHHCRAQRHLLLIG